MWIKNPKMEPAMKKLLRFIVGVAVCMIGLGSLVALVEHLSELNMTWILGYVVMIVICAFLLFRLSKSS